MVKETKMLFANQTTTKQTGDPPMPSAESSNSQEEKFLKMATISTVEIKTVKKLKIK